MKKRSKPSAGSNWKIHFILLCCNIHGHLHSKEKGTDTKSQLISTD